MCAQFLWGADSPVEELTLGRLDDECDIWYQGLCLGYPPREWSTEFNGKLGTFEKEAKEGKIMNQVKVTEVNLKLTSNAVVP